MPLTESKKKYLFISVFIFLLVIFFNVFFVSNSYASKIDEIKEQIKERNDKINEAENEIKKYDQFVYLKTVELIERHWKIDGRVARPNSEGIGHTAFLSFFRKIK